jgi:sugar (pentulose or hexulose) kinase
MSALGIDIGTSKVAIALVDASGTQLAAASSPHRAALPAPAGRHEQDASRIVDCAEALVAGLPAAQRADIAAIGFTGQMHGVVLHDAAGAPMSPQVTWQDRRAHEDPAFLAALPPGLLPGFGLTTLAWWAANNGLPAGARAATIHGLLAARWGGLDRAPIDPTDLQAWGGQVAAPGVDAAVLPRLVGHGERIGTLSQVAAARLGLRAGIALAAPLGDNQASIRATLADPDHELAFTIGTGCQLSAVVRRGACTPVPGCDVRPFDAQRDALVAAPMAGGAAWLWLADTAASWARSLGCEAPARDVVLSRLDELGLAAADRLDFASHLAGERHAPDLRATLSGLALDAGSLGEVARAVARGIVASARDMLPAGAWAGRTRVVASGNALRRSHLLRAMAEAELRLPLVLVDRAEEAATGAALVALGMV